MDGKKEEVSRFEKVYDYLEAIIALAEKARDFQTQEDHAIKTLAIDCSNALTRLEEEIASS